MQAHHSKNDPVQWRPKKGPTAPEWAALPPVSPGGSYSGAYVLPMELGPPSGIAHRPVDMGALEPHIHWRHNSLPFVFIRVLFAWLPGRWYNFGTPIRHAVVLSRSIESKHLEKCKPSFSSSPCF